MINVIYFFHYVTFVIAIVYCIVLKNNNIRSQSIIDCIHGSCTYSRLVLIAMIYLSDKTSFYK